MGTSTNGILVFGISYDEDEMPPFMEEFDNDFDAYLASISGLPAYGEPGHDFKNDWAFRDACPADLTLHCSHDYPMHILSVRGTEITAHRGEPVEITSLNVPAEKLEAFKAWCAERGVTEEPKWYLCSMWG